MKKLFILLAMTFFLTSCATLTGPTPELDQSLEELLEQAEGAGYDSTMTGAEVQAELDRCANRGTTVGDPGSDAKLVTEEAVREALVDTEITIYGRSETVQDAFNVGLRDGIFSGVVVTDAGGLNVSWTSGTSFVDSSLFAVNSAGSTALTDNAYNYLYVLKDNSTLQISTTEPTEVGVGAFALRGEYRTWNGDIIHPCEFPDSGELRYKVSRFLAEIMPTMVVSGVDCIVDTDATNANDFKINTGNYFITAYCEKTISSIVYSAGVGHAANDTEAHYHSAGSWTTGAENGINFGYWDNGTQKTAVDINKWYCGYIFGKNDDIPIYLYPQVEHGSESEAIIEDIVYPPYHEGVVLPIARFIFRGSATAFDGTAYFVDIRPFLGTGGGAASVQNIYQTVTGDSGSTTATASNDSIAITGTAPVVTAVTADAVDISMPAATNSQNGYATSAQIIALEAAAQLNEAETITANWVNTANPWADDEIANDLTLDLLKLSVLTSAPSSPAACMLYRADTDTWNPGDMPGTDDVVYIYDGADYKPFWDENGTVHVSSIELPSFSHFATGDATYNDTTSPHVLTIEEVKGGNITNAQTGGPVDKVYTLPEAGFGFNGMAQIIAAAQMDFEPHSGEYFILNGTQMAVDEHIQNTADNKGDVIVFWSVESGDGTYEIFFKSDNTNWVEETP